MRFLNSCSRSLGLMSSLCMFLSLLPQYTVCGESSPITQTRSPVLQPGTVSGLMIFWGIASALVKTLPNELAMDTAGKPH